MSICYRGLLRYWTSSSHFKTFPLLVRNHHHHQWRNHHLQTFKTYYSLPQQRCMSAVAAVGGGVERKQSSCGPSKYPSNLQHEITRRGLHSKFQFHHNENVNAERLFRNMPSYQNTLFQIDENDIREKHAKVISQGAAGAAGSDQVVVQQPASSWRRSVTEFVEAAYLFQDELPITHPKNHDVVQQVLKELKYLSDEELCQVLYHVRHFAPCPSSKDPPYAKIWSELDKECLSRHTSWSLDFNFVVADLWYGLNLARLSEFHWTLLKKLFRKCHRLSKEHFVRFMFCLNLNRQIPDNATTYDLEYHLYKIVDQLNAEEVAIIAMAFFKTQTALRDLELMKKLLHISMASHESLDSISVAAIAKFARLSTDFKSSQIIAEFQERFIPDIPRLSITACTHLTLTGTNTLAPHLGLVQLVVNRIEENVTEARLKELERISLAMTMYNADCDNLCRLIGEELRKSERADEIRKYGRCLPGILHYLSIREVFLPDLISMCLSKEYRDTYYGGKGKETFQRELLCLDVVADLEIPGYSGNRLQEKVVKYVMKRNMLRLKSGITKLSIYQKFVKAVTDTIGSLNETADLYMCSILPHHPTVAIVFCRNQDGQFVKVPQYYLDIESHLVKKIEESPNLTYHAVVLCGRNMFLWNTKELTGQAQLQIRQTKKLGYITHLVHYNEWINFAGPSQQRAYIEDVLTKPDLLA